MRRRDRKHQAAAPQAASDKRKCYFASEIADMLGLTVDALYVQRDRLHQNGMPRSATAGRIRIPKLAFEAWLNRDHPDAPKSPPAANDPLPFPAPETDQEHRSYLRVAYKR